MRIVKSKAFIGILCIAAALAFSFIGLPALNHLENKTVPVVRAKTEIRQGTKITENMLEVVKLSANNLQANAVKQQSAVVGSFAAVDIQAHDIITGVKYTATQQAYNLADGQMLISVTIKNFADGLSGKLQSGDIVTVFVPQQSGQAQQAGNNAVQKTAASSAASAKADNPVELQYVKVAAVTAADGTATDQTQLKTSSSQSSAQQPATVTLLVNKQQAAVLAAMNQNELHLALVSRGDSKKAQELLDKQNSLLPQEAK